MRWGECDWCGPSAATSLTRVWVRGRDVWVCSRCADEIAAEEAQMADPTAGAA